MELSFITGIVGSIILLIGAAWPIEKTNDPTKSVKNWLFAIGSFIMLLYAVLGYFTGWLMFFIVLELLVMLAIVLMILNTHDRLDTWLIGVAGILLIVRSVIAFSSVTMVLFVVSFIILWLGYAYDMHSTRRYLWLTIGGALIALSSYLDASWIFFWLNVFFALFSLYYTIKLMRTPKKHIASPSTITVTKKTIATTAGKIVKKKVIKKTANKVTKK